MRRAEWMFASAVLMFVPVTAGRGIAHLARYNIKPGYQGSRGSCRAHPDYGPDVSGWAFSNTYYPALARQRDPDRVGLAHVVSPGLAELLRS